MEKQLQELRALAASAENRRTETGIPRVAMVQGEIPEHQLSAVYEPMINLILTGSKTMTVGDRTFAYDPATYFVMSVDLPAVGSVHPSATGEPYLAVSLTLHPPTVAALINDLPVKVCSTLFGSGFSVAPVSEEFLDAWVRMLRLMDRPDEVSVLAPAYEREILFRVLQGPLGWMLRDIAAPDAAISRIGVAIQYQKQVRLLHARTLLMAGEGSATSVAFGVGYESPNQFSREYARQFGLPPSKDVVRLRGEAA